MASKQSSKFSTSTAFRATSHLKVETHLPYVYIAAEVTHCNIGSQMTAQQFAYLLCDYIRELPARSLGEVVIVLEVVAVDASQKTHANHVPSNQWFLHTGKHRMEIMTSP